MNFPAHFNLQLDEQDKADLADAQSTFVASMQGLSEEEQVRRARVTASGIRESDPFTRALARQVVDAADTRAKIVRLQDDLRTVEADLRHGGHRPKNPHWRGEALERKEALQREMEQSHARLIGLAEEDFAPAQRKAALHFRERRQQAAKTAAFKEAIAVEEARLEAEDLQRRAAEIARARRMNAGKSGRDAGESQ